MLFALKFILQFSDLFLERRYEILLEKALDGLVTGVFSSLRLVIGLCWALSLYFQFLCRFLCLYLCECQFAAVLCHHAGRLEVTLRWYLFKLSFRSTLCNELGFDRSPIQQVLASWDFLQAILHIGFRWDRIAHNPRRRKLTLFVKWKRCSISVSVRIMLRIVLGSTIVKAWICLLIFKLKL